MGYDYPYSIRGMPGVAFTQEALVSMWPCVYTDNREALILGLAEQECRMPRLVVVRLIKMLGQWDNLALCQHGCRLVCGDAIWMLRKWAQRETGYDLRDMPYGTLEAMLEVAERRTVRGPRE